MGHPVGDFIAATKLTTPVDSNKSKLAYGHAYLKGVVLQIANVIEALDERKVLKITHGENSTDALTVQIKGRKTPLFQLHIDTERNSVESIPILLATEGKRTRKSLIQIMGTLGSDRPSYSDEHLAKVFEWVGEKVGPVLRGEKRTARPRATATAPA